MSDFFNSLLGDSAAAEQPFDISEAERRFPVRIRLALPAAGFGTKPKVDAWLDENCGDDTFVATRRRQSSARWYMAS